jgi:hypothetical protein
MEQLFLRVEEASGILARHQRLIYRGKVLGTSGALSEAKIKDGSKIMLVASSGTATQVFCWSCVL